MQSELIGGLTAAHICWFFPQEAEKFEKRTVSVFMVENRAVVKNLASFDIFSAVNDQRTQNVYVGHTDAHARSVHVRGQQVVEH